MDFEPFLQGWDPAIHLRYTTAGVVTADEMREAISDYLKLPVRQAFVNAYKRGGFAMTIQQLAMNCITVPFPIAVAAFAMRGGAQAKITALSRCNLNMTPVLRHTFTAGVHTMRALIIAGALPRFILEANNANTLAHVSNFDDYRQLIINGDAGSTEDVRGFVVCLRNLVAGFRRNWGGDFNSNNRNRQVADALEQDVVAILNQLPLPANALMESTLIDNVRIRWDRVKDETASYFQTEVPAYRARRADLIALRAAAAANANPVVTLYRHVSAGEAQDVINNAILRQPPAPLEKEKWFTTNVNAVGGGVIHGSLLTIVLRAGAFHALTGAANAAAYSGANVPGRPWVRVRTDADWAHHLVYIKANEPTCFGIHEDAIGVMNELINYIEVRNPSTAPQPIRVNFVTVADYPVI